jgi:hypothetical protein
MIFTRHQCIDAINALGAEWAKFHFGAIYAAALAPEKGWIPSAIGVMRAASRRSSP